MNYTKDTIEFVAKPTHWRFIDRTGKKFGRLTILGYGGKGNTHRNSFWYAECECGKVVRVAGSAVTTGHTVSCGCFWLEQHLQSLKERSTHNDTGTPEYQAFMDAKRRCHNKDHPAYRNYGGRGIEFRFESYVDFISHIGRRPSSAYSLDRKDNNGHYEIGNVRWATKSEQAQNRRQRHRLVAAS